MESKNEKEKKENKKDDKENIKPEEKKIENRRFIEENITRKTQSDINDDTFPEDFFPYKKS